MHSIDWKLNERLQMSLHSIFWIVLMAYIKTVMLYFLLEHDILQPTVSSCIFVVDETTVSEFLASRHLAGVLGFVSFLCLWLRADFQCFRGVLCTKSKLCEVSSIVNCGTWSPHVPAWDFLKIHNKFCCYSVCLVCSLEFFTVIEIVQ